MRVMHTIAGLDPSFGGPSRSVPALCSAIREYSEYVEIVSQDFNKKGIQVIEEDSITKTLVPGTHFSRLGVTFSSHFRSVLLSRCKANNIQLIHDHGAWLQSNHSSASVARSLGIPYVNSPRGMFTKWALTHRAWKKTLALNLYQNKILSNAHAFVTTSQEEAEGLRLLKLVQPISVIPNGVTIPDATRRTSSALQPERLALFMSRLNPTKGVVELVRAWSSVRPSGWSLVIAGPDEDEYAAVVLKCVRESGLSDCVRVIGSIDGGAKEWHLRNADLFVLPTHTESFGIAIAEALAYGLPVLTTHGAPWKTIEEHKAGWWIPDEQSALVNALRIATSTSADDLQGMGSRGRDLVSTQYSWMRVGQQVVQFYDWIIHGGQAPSTLFQG